MTTSDVDPFRQRAIVFMDAVIDLCRKHRFAISTCQDELEVFPMDEGEDVPSAMKEINLSRGGDECWIALYPAAEAAENERRAAIQAKWHASRPVSSMPFEGQEERRRALARANDARNTGMEPDKS